MKPTVLNPKILPALSKNLKAAIILIIGISITACNQDLEPAPPVKDTIDHFLLEQPYAVQYLQAYPLDINQDGVDDFLLNVIPVNFSEGYKEHYQISSNWHGRILLTDNEITPLEEGKEISGETNIQGSGWSIFTGSLMVRTVTENQPDQWSGSWSPDRGDFAGMSLRINGEYYYGWVKLLADKESHAVFVQEFAFQTIPNKPIKAGQKK